MNCNIIHFNNIIQSVFYITISSTGRVLYYNFCTRFLQYVYYIEYLGAKVQNKKTSHISDLPFLWGGLTMKERISNFNVKPAFVSSIVRLIQPLDTLIRFVVLPTLQLYYIIIDIICQDYL